MSAFKTASLLFLVGCFSISKAACPVGTVAFGAQCNTCAGSCASCTGTVDDCTSCVAGTFLLGARCVPAAGCPGQTVPQNGICSPCTGGCATCAGTPSTCTSCLPDKYLLGSSCVDAAKCPVGTTIATAGQCYPCVGPCATCSGSRTDCLSCVAGTYLLGNLCVPAAGCPAGTIPFNRRCVKNDVCSNAIPITCGGSATGDTTYAQIDDMWDCDVSHSAPQLWYYVDAGAGQLQASTCNGATWDTQISVYRGWSCNALTCIKGVDDGCGSQTDLSTPVYGGRYYIMVHGYNGKSGPFTLNVACSIPSPASSRSPSQRPALPSPSASTRPSPKPSPKAQITPSPIASTSPAPANEQCNMAVPVQCGSTVYGDTSVTQSDGTWDCAVAHSSGQVWYYVDARAGQLQVSTCNAATAWDTQLSVYSGLDCINMQCVDGVDDGCGSQSLLNLAVTTGRYYIMVHGFGSSSGPFALQITCGTPSPLPSPASMSPSLSPSRSPRRAKNNGVAVVVAAADTPEAISSVTSQQSSLTPYYALLALIPMVGAGIFVIMRVRAQHRTVEMVMDFSQPEGQVTALYELAEGYRTPYDLLGDAEGRPSDDFITPPPCSKPLPATPMDLPLP